MQNKTKAYAQALKEVLENATNKVQGERISNFKKLVKRRGDLKLVSKIFQEFQKLWLERNGKIGKVVSAKPLSAALGTHTKNALRRKGFLLMKRRSFLHI